VWRGRYNGHAQKAGYREAKDFQINLMNETGTKIKCKLVGSGAAASEESYCELEN
jgi:hypothetical protein